MLLNFGLSVCGSPAVHHPWFFRIAIIGICRYVVLRLSVFCLWLFCLAVLRPDIMPECHHAEEYRSKRQHSSDYHQEGISVPVTQGVPAVFYSFFHLLAPFYSVTSGISVPPSPQLSTSMLLTATVLLLVSLRLKVYRVPWAKVMSLPRLYIKSP